MLLLNWVIFTLLFESNIAVQFLFLIRFPICFGFRAIIEMFWFFFKTISFSNFRRSEFTHYHFILFLYELTKHTNFILNVGYFVILICAYHVFVFVVYFDMIVSACMALAQKLRRVSWLIDLLFDSKVCPTSARQGGVQSDLENDIFLTSVVQTVFPLCLTEIERNKFFK